MLEFENQNIKFKQEYVPDIRKEVMVFANAEGGTVYVGVRQDGAVLVLAIGGAVIMTGAASLGTSFAILPELKKSKKQKKRVQRIRLFQGVARRRPPQNISTEALVN